MAASDDERPDSSEHATHLRTVHFTLLIACAVLFATAFTRVKTDAEQACEQLAQIQAVMQKWDYWWLENEVEKQLTWEHFLLTEDHFASRLVGATGIRIKPRASPWTLHPAPEFLRVLDARGDDLKPYFPYSSDKHPLVIDAPGTIVQIKALWDGLQQPIPVYYPKSFGGDAYVYLTDGYDVAGDVQQAPLTRADEETGVSADSVRFDMLDPQEVARIGTILTTLADQYTHAYAGASGPPDGDVYRIIIPVTTTNTELDGRRGFERAFQVDWGARPFSHLFRELDHFTDTLGLENLTLAQSAAVLELERQRAADRYDFFGIEVPATVVLQWGLLAILVLQAYFCLHMGQFRCRLVENDHAFDVPWIGIYRDRPSRVVTFMTTSCLAPFVAIGLAYTVLAGVNRWWAIVAVVLGCLISLGLSTWSYLEFRSIWRLPNAAQAHDSPQPGTQP